MSETPNADKLADALALTGFITVVRKSESENSVRLLCRVSDKRAWCSVLEYVLVRKKDWTEHVCQQYFLKDTKLVFGWNVIVNSDNTSKAVDNFCRLLRGIKTTTKSKVPESSDTMPLMGASHRRNAPLVFDPRQPGPGRGGPSHKGAYTIGGGDS
jgi:hypothetical protein